jgi:hypothetical protein
MDKGNSLTETTEPGKDHIDKGNSLTKTTEPVNDYMDKGNSLTEALPSDNGDSRVSNNGD